MPAARGVGVTEVERGGEDKDFISSWVKIARVGRVFGYYLIYSVRHPDLIIKRILLKKKSLHNHLKHDFNIFMFNNNSMTCKCIDGKIRSHISQTRLS